MLSARSSFTGWVRSAFTARVNYLVWSNEHGVNPTRWRLKLSLGKGTLMDLPSIWVLAGSRTPDFVGTFLREGVLAVEPV